MPDLAELHRVMATSRAIETHCVALSPHWYPSLGEEAVLAGTWSQLREDDFAVPHYRGALLIPWLRGRSLKDVLACVRQRRSSPTGGRLYGAFAGDIERRVMPYVTMVLGPNLGVATGIAFAFSRQPGEAIAIASLGDGTAGTGDFHEALNLAGSLRLPVVFVCQNNQVSISTPTAVTHAGESIASWASRYGMPAERVDGNDVEAVAAAVGSAAGRARAGAGPSFVEALTYRQTGHFGADPAAYRDAAEAEEWAARDPLAAVEARLKAGGMSADALDAVRRDAEAAVERAAAALEDEPPLGLADLGVVEVLAR
jgi:TPP-dependent pyruvate/acetoin dehydrogenase alpha subunit